MSSERRTRAWTAAFLGLAVACAVACRPGPQGGGAGTSDDSGTGEDGGETGGVGESLSELDCTEDDAAFGGLEASTGQIPTLLDVSWTSVEDTVGQVYFEVDPGELRETPREETSTTAHSLQLRGAPENHEVSFRVVDDQGRCSSLQTTSTGDLPASLPILEHSGSTDSSLGYTVAPILSSDTHHIAVIDPRGRYVWAMELARITSRIEPLPDGEGFVISEPAAAGDTWGAVIWIDWNGEEITRVPVELNHTDMVLADDGTVYVLTWREHVMEFDGETRYMLGHVVMNADPVSGEATEVWSAMDHYPPNLNLSWSNTNYWGGTQWEDWAHVNGISADEDADSLLLSLTNQDIVISVDIETEETEWTLGRQAESLDFDEDHPDPPVKAPHSVFRRPDGRVLIFNRMDLADTEACSRAVVYELDLAAGTAEHHATMDSGEDCLKVYFLGQARPIGDDGRTQVTWTTSGQIDQFDANQERIWSVASQLGAGFAYTGHLDTLY